MRRAVIDQEVNGIGISDMVDQLIYMIYKKGKKEQQLNENKVFRMCMMRRAGTASEWLNTYCSGYVIS